MSRVLLVEDDQMGALALRRYLEFDQIEVDIVPTVEEALVSLGKHPYSAIISDLLLSGVSGEEMARRLRRTPLICLSGQQNIEQAQHFDHLIRKPCSASQLDALTKLITGGGR